jgi:hypothetical protein
MRRSMVSACDSVLPLLTPGAFFTESLSAGSRPSSAIAIAPSTVFLHYRISTYPSVPCTRIRCPSLISLVAFSTPTTAGKPYSRAMTAPWVLSPPTSVTRPLMDTNNGVQLGSVKEVTKISPSSRTASSRFKMTRARPSITPDETGRPTMASAGRFSRLYSPATISPSEVMTRAELGAAAAGREEAQWTAA